MHLTTSRTDISKKQKPLQRSMLLSDKCIQPMKTQTHTITIDTASLSSMKRSCISAMDGTPRANTLSIKNTINNQTPPPSNYYGQSNSHNYYSSEVRSPEPYQMSHQNNQYNTINTRHSYPTVQNNENEYNLPLRNGHGIVEQSLNYDNWINSKEQFKISNQIIEAIKEKHLGNWLKPLRQEIIEQVNKVKGQLQSLRAEWNLEKGIQASQNRDMRAEIAKIMNSKTSLNPANGKIRKDADLSDLEKQFSSVQQRIGQLENKFGDCFNKLVADFQKAHLSQNQQKIKPGILRSALPPIILQYRQSFVVQRTSTAVKSSQNHQIVFTSEFYHIDKHGFLMDSQSRYLLDGDNKQIRLDEQQIRLLEEHDVLKR